MSEENEFDEAFDGAFAAATGGEPAADVEVPTSPAAAPAAESTDGDTPVKDEPAAESADGDTPVKDEPAAESAASGADGDVPKAPAAVAPVVPAPVPQPPLDPQFIAQAVAEQMRKQQASPDPAPTAAPEAYVPKTADDFLTAEQKAALAVFDSDWNDVAPVVRDLLAATIQAERANIRQEVMAEVGQTLAPVQQLAAKSQGDAFNSAVEAAHPDWREVAQKLPEWIESDPLVRDRLMDVYQNGTAQEAINLISRFKQATGQPSAAPVKPASPAPQVTPKAAPSKAALAATMAPPRAQRSATTAAKDPADFDAAFEEAAKQTG